MLPGSGFQDARPDGCTDLGSRNFRGRSSGEWRETRWLLRCLCLAGTGEVRFDEAKVGPDRLRDTQRMFVQKALRFRRLTEFTIIEITHNLGNAAALSSRIA